MSTSQLDYEQGYREIQTLLRKFDKGELDEILTNEEQLNELFDNLEARKKIEGLRETLVNRNHSLAESNLELEPRLRDGRNRLVDTYQNRREVQAAFDSNKKKLEEVASNYAPDTTLALLQAATAQAEEEAEKTVDKFLEKEISSDEFIQKFLVQKTLHHLRRTKTEKLTEVLRNRTTSQYSYRY